MRDTEWQRVSVFVDKAEVIGTVDFLAAIADPEIKRRGIAVLYAISIRMQFGQTDWELVDKAIIQRWSTAGLKYITELAWKAVEQAVTV